MNETKSSAASGQPGRHSDASVEEMIRVDHAGEYGAVRIYAGQLAVLRGRPGTEDLVARLEHMLEDEQRHLDRFDELIAETGTRPTALHPFWHLAGYALGAGTALLGEKAALACTAAVEEEIDAHYKSQLDELAATRAGPADLADTIRTFRDEEIAHRDEALAHGAEETPGYPILSGAIRLGCRLAIAAAKKV